MPQLTIELALPKRMPECQRQKLTKEILDILGTWWMHVEASRADNEAQAARESLREIAKEAISALEKARDHIEFGLGTTKEEDMPRERYVPAVELDKSITDAIAEFRKCMAQFERHNTSKNRGRPPASDVELVEGISEIATNGGLKPKQTKYLIAQIRREIDPTLPTVDAAKKRRYRSGQRRRTK